MSKISLYCMIINIVVC